MLRKRASAVDETHHRNEYVDLIYPKMRAASSQFESEEVHFYDMTQIFSEVRETVYRDVCCHLNDVGKDALASAIVSNISETLTLPDLGD